jgi:hypothetical protein
MAIYVSHEDDAEYGTLKLTRASTATAAVLADYASPPKPVRRVTYGGNDLKMHLPARRPSFMRRLVRNLEEVSITLSFNANALILFSLTQFCALDVEQDMRGTYIDVIDQSVEIDWYSSDEDAPTQPLWKRQQSQLSFDASQPPDAVTTGIDSVTR